MRAASFFFAVLLAIAMTGNAYAKKRHHHHHHHHHYHHHHHVAVPTENDMKAWAAAGVLSLFAPIPITILVTSAAHDAGEIVLAHQRHHHHHHNHP